MKRFCIRLIALSFLFTSNSYGVAKTIEDCEAEKAKCTSDEISTQNAAAVSVCQQASLEICTLTAGLQIVNNTKYAGCMDEASYRISRRIETFNKETCEPEFEVCKKAVQVNVPPDPPGPPKPPVKPPDKKKIAAVDPVTGKTTDPADPATDPSTSPSTDPSSDPSTQQPSSTSPSQATGDPSMDLQQARAAADAAVMCCSNPSAPQCSSIMPSGGSGGLTQVAGMAAQLYAQQQQQATMGGQGNGGMQAACQMMQGLGGGGSAGNAGYAGVCYAKMSSCTSMIDQMMSTYSSQPDVQSQLSNYRTTCQNQNSKYQMLSQQSTAGASSGGMGDVCSQLAMQGATPQSFGQQPTCMQDPTNPACVDCNTNPSNPNCIKAAQEAAPNAQFREAQASNGFDSFNTPEMPTTGDPSLVQPASEAYQSLGATVVANNTGGGIPNGGGAGGGASGGRGGGGGSAGYNTDVLHNAQLTGTGGFSGYGAGSMNMEASGGSGFSGYKSASASDNSGFMGMDLKKYLPGQEKDPNRRPAGLGSISAEIGPKYGDIFKRISDRMQTVCRFNRLLDCETK